MGLIGYGGKYGYGMMGGGGYGGVGILSVMMWSVWLVVGILAAVWLWRNINKK